jgi:hypothetical protein
MRHLFLCVLACVALSMPPYARGGDEEPAVAPAGLEFAVVRAWFRDRSQVDRLAAERSPWLVDHKKRYIIIDVDAAGYQRLLELGFRVEIDEALTARYRTPPQRLPGQTQGIPGFPCYRTVEETYASAEALVQSHPQLARWIDIGDSWEKAAGTGGHDLMVLRLTNSATPGPKPKLFAMGAIHAREYTTAELLTRFAEQLVADYGVDADATWLLDTQEIHLLLQSNPDGRKKAEAGLLWRKNTNRNYCGPTSNNRGADLNRNYPFKWDCCGGSDDNECGEAYHGAFAASEPETQAVRDYVATLFPDVRPDPPNAPAPVDTPGLFLDVHSFGQLVLWPWGYTPADAPNGTAMQTLGRKLAWLNGHLPEQAFDLYITDGTTDDFAYGELGVAAYTFEVGVDFFETCDSFESRTLPLNMQALRYAAKASRLPYLAPAGPDALGLALSTNIVGPGEPVTLRATLDDTRYSDRNGTEPRQNVVAARYYVDVPPWAGGTTPTGVPMEPADGAFDAQVEDVVATVPTAALPLGRHTLYVQGRDAAGNEGVVSAAFLHVVDPDTAPSLAGRVTAAGSGAPVAATISANAQFTAQTDPETGEYGMLLVPGTYDVTATSVDGEYAPATVTGIQADEGDDIVQDFQLYPYCDLFADDVENGNAGWTAQPPWAITTEDFASPTHSWTDSPGGDYQSRRITSLTSPPIDFTGYVAAQLRFNQICDTEEGYDYCIVEVSPDGSTWQTVASYDGAASEWESVVLDIPQVAGHAGARVRFKLQTDPLVTADGWHLDDIRIRGAGSACVTAPDTDQDGIADAADNCTLVANPDQRDTNGDGYGNVCDADLDNNGIINFLDLALMKQAFFDSGDLDADLDGNGRVNFVDLGMMKSSFFGPPGPSGIADAD